MMTYVPCGVDMVVVFSDGTWQFVPEDQSILWYDWQGEFHIL